MPESLKRKTKESEIIKFMRKNWMLLIAIVYVLSPIDFLPDVLPLLGFGDDIFVMLFTLYLRWQQHRSDSLKDNVIEGEVLEN